MSMTNVMNEMGKFGTGVTDTANAAEQAAARLGQNEQVTEPTEQKSYTLRALCAKDVFPMVKIIHKIGLKDIGKAFNPEEIKAITESVSEEENATVDSIAETVGVAVVLKIVDVILENLEAAEQEIFGFLGGLAGMTADEVGSLPMDVFFEMLMDTFQSKEFVGFMKVVSRFLK